MPFRLARFTADAARAGNRSVAILTELLVVGLKARRRRLVPKRAVAAADLFERSAYLEVRDLDRVDIRPHVARGLARRLAERCGIATLREALLTTLLLTSLGTLSVAGHRLRSA